jgi:hypothetical protein
MPSKIEMLFSDLEIGTQEYGFIKRGNDEDEDDFRYQRFLRKTYQNLKNARVANGYVFLN